MKLTERKRSEVKMETIEVCMGLRMMREDTFWDARILCFIVSCQCAIKRYLCIAHPYLADY